MRQATREQIALSKVVDKRLLEIIRDGRPIIDEATGLPLKDADGKEIRTTPSAADINAAINRLKQCGVAVVPTAGNDIGKLRAQMRRRGIAGRIGPVDTEHDDPATAGAA